MMNQELSIKLTERRKDTKIEKKAAIWQVEGLPLFKGLKKCRKTCCECSLVIFNFINF